LATFRETSTDNSLLQIRNEILSEDIFCPAEKAVMLASYQTQAKFGDHDSDKHSSGYLANEKLMPAKVLSGHSLSIQQWEDKVSCWSIEFIYDFLTSWAVDGK
jgi:hypothetical protein